MKAHHFSKKLPWVLHDEPVASTSALSPEHFLSQPLPNFTQIKSPEWINGSLDTSSLSAADFDIDVATGFLPPQPIAKLTGAYSLWEDLWDASGNVQLNTQDDSWREQVRNCAIVKADGLQTTQELRRAHVILAFLSHRYLHSLPPNSPSPAILPASLAIPFLSVSERLDLPPVLTYADTVLWNWSLESPSQGIFAENFKINTTLTGTPDEDWFFMVSLLIELRGVLALRLMALALDEAFVNDALAQQRLAVYLYDIAQNIDDLTELIKSTKRDCAPLVFYDQIRPWFHGGKRIFQLEKGETKEVDLGGPSAGQSTLIHALDLFFSIDHSPKETSSSSLDETFMMRMSHYMPHHHRLFLRHLKSQEPSIRSLALASPQGSAFRESYDLCIDAIKGLREAHTALVFSHIITPSQRGSNKDQVGTGGTNINTFLRMTRERTVSARLVPR